MFTTQTRVDFNPGTSNEQTVLDLIAADRPGLLSKVGQVFAEHRINIASAKIMTIGERAEDVFYISDESGQALDNDAQDKLRNALLDKLPCKK
jgi:[protein-PII] uridylyltransferase